MNWGLITRDDLTEVARARKLGKLIGTAFRQVKPPGNESWNYLHRRRFSTGRYTPIAHSVPI